MNPFSFITGLLGNLVPIKGGGTTTGPQISFTPAQFQALLAAVETFGPMAMGMTPQQVAVAQNLLVAFGYGNLLPKA